MTRLSRAARQLRSITGVELVAPPEVKRRKDEEGPASGRSGSAAAEEDDEEQEAGEKLPVVVLANR